MNISLLFDYTTSVYHPIAISNGDFIFEEINTEIIEWSLKSFLFFKQLFLRRVQVSYKEFLIKKEWIRK